MSIQISIFESLLQECADQCAADPFFADVPVLVEHLKDYQSEYERALGPANSAGGNTGVCVIFLATSADCKKPNLAGPFYEEVRITARVRENVEVNQRAANGTGKTALRVCQQVAARLHHFPTVGGRGVVTPLTPSITRGADDEFANYEVRFATKADTADPLPALPVPSSQLSNGQLTLACATPGAAIFYTQDGSNPSPRNGTLYLAPFTPTGGVRANAWLAGYLTSPTAQF